MEGKKSFVVASLAYVVLGLVLLFFPDLTTGFICTAVGLILLAYGITAVISFFAGGNGGFSFQFELVIGVFAAILGMLFLLKPHILLSILPIIFGLYILVDGLTNLKRGLDMRAYGYAGWTTTLVMSVISMILGAVILWNPFSTHLLLVRIIGGTFLYEGISDLWATHTLDKLMGEK